MAMLTIVKQSNLITMAAPKRVHFGKNGGDISLNIIIIECRTSPLSMRIVRGDISATARGHATDDPDWLTLAIMRRQRMQRFREKAMTARDVYWRTDTEKLRNAFITLLSP
jgi:hypothetical protein